MGTRRSNLSVDIMRDAAGAEYKLDFCFFLSEVSEM